MKREKSIGVYLTLSGGVVALFATILYRSVMYHYQPVYYFLIGAIVLSAAAFAVAGIVPIISALVPVVNAALMASSFIWATSVMVNQIGYVFSGLDGVGTIMTYIVFSTVAIVGMLLFIIAAFLPAVKERTAK